MTTQQTAEKWYKVKTENHQGLIISEIDGRNIAVTYDEKDADIVAAAPEMLAALKDLYNVAEHLPELYGNKLHVLNAVRAAIAKAERRG